MTKFELFPLPSLLLKFKVLSVCLSVLSCLVVMSGDVCCCVVLFDVEGFENWGSRARRAVGQCLSTIPVDDGISSVVSCFVWLIVLGDV